MNDILLTIAVCLALSIIGLIALQVAKAAGEYDHDTERGRELSNAEVTAIITRKRD